MLLTLLVFVNKPHTPLVIYTCLKFALLKFQCGDLQTSYIVVQKALEAYPTHVNSRTLLKELTKHFTTI